MGKPGGSHVPSPVDEFIVVQEPTQGSETSQYLKERKSNETPSVAASEGGLAQTRGIRSAGVVGPAYMIRKYAGEESWKASPERVTAPYLNQKATLPDP